MTNYFLVVPTYSRELGYTRNVFGPYKTEEKVRQADDELGSNGEIIELETDTLSEAIEILNRGST